MASHHQKQVSVIMVAIGGYGYHYLKTLLEAFPPGAVELRAVVDPIPEESGLFPEMRRLKIPVFHYLEDFYQTGGVVDLVVVASPLQYHVDQSCEALQHGSHVLCEKPVSATIQEVDRLIGCRDRAKKWVMIGYQWSYSGAIQNLKRDILNGLFGRPIRGKTLYLWPRDKSYYQRNDWAGKKKDKRGLWILDSPANSAMAHDLHNLLFLLGEKIECSAQPSEVLAELYRANPIENYDSIACRVMTEMNNELLFYASHAVPEKRGPFFSLEFKDATVTYGESGDDILARDNKGHEKRYGSPEDDHHFRKLFEAVNCVTQPGDILCGPEASRSQVLCVNGIQESAPEIVTFPESMVQYDNTKRLRWVKDLSEVFYDCYRKSILPSEVNITWAQCGQKIDLRNYHYYPGGTRPENPESR